MQGGTRITFVGHATLLIETGGIRILTDPVLRDRLFHLRRHSVAVRSEWYQRIDAVLISHAHWDHFDLPSLRLLDPTVPLIVPRDMGHSLRKRGFEHVTALRLDEAVVVGGAMITARDAAHSGGLPFISSGVAALSYLIHGDHSIYFAGDTDLFPGMTGLAEQLEVALIPIWGWGLSAEVGHLNPYRAAQSLTMLQPRLAIPIHWGTLFPIGLRRFMPEFLTDPPHLFQRRASKVAPEVDVCVLQPGSRLDVDDRLSLSLDSGA